VQLYVACLDVTSLSKTMEGFKASLPVVIVDRSMLHVAEDRYSTTTQIVKIFDLDESDRNDRRVHSSIMVIISKFMQNRKPPMSAHHSSSP